MKRNPLLADLIHCPVSHLAAIVLVGLAWGSAAFWGEIHEAVPAGNLKKVRAVIVHSDGSDEP